MEKRLIAGIFLLLSFIMGIILAAAMQVGWAVAGLDPTGTFESILMVCTALVAVFSLLALLGGIACFTGKSYGLAIVGAIFGLVSIGYAGLGSVFGLIGLILVLISKEEFAGNEPQPPQYGMPPPGYPMQPPPGYPPQQQMPPQGYPPQQQMPPPGYPPQQQMPPPAQQPAQPEAPPPAETPEKPPEE